MIPRPLLMTSGALVDDTWINTQTHKRGSNSDLAERKDALENELHYALDTNGERILSRFPTSLKGSNPT